MRGIVCILITLLWAVPTLAVTSPDMFERVGSAPVEEIRSFAAEGSRVCLLLDNAVALAKHRRARHLDVSSYGDAAATIL